MANKLAQFKVTNLINLKCSNLQRSTEAIEKYMII